MVRKLIAIVLLFAAAGAGCSAEEDSSTETTSSAEAEHVDSGRMSGSEFEEMRLFTRRFLDEADTFIGQVTGKCGNLARAGELAAASDCGKDAYDGVDAKAGGAYSVYTDLIGSTAKTCRRSVRRLRTALDKYTTSMKVAENLVENLEPSEELGRLAGKDLAKKQRTFSVRRRAAFSRCSPT